MTDELKKMIQEAITEEQADHDKYKKMSEMASDPCAGVLCDIAHEEHTHMKLLEELLEEE